MSTEPRPAAPGAPQAPAAFEENAAWRDVWDGDAAAAPTGDDAADAPDADGPGTVTIFAAPRRPTGLWLVAGAVALCLCVAAAIWAWQVRPPQSAGGTADGAPSAAREAAWRRSVGGDTFSQARAAAKKRGRSLSEAEMESLARQILRETTGRPVPDAELLRLALRGARNGGTLPYAAPPRTARAKPRIARRRPPRRTAPEKHAVILGRGAIANDQVGIIRIRD